MTSSKLISAFFAVVSVLTGCTAIQNTIAPPVMTHEAEVLNFKPPVPERWSLSNGLRVIYLKDDELPVVRGSLLLKGGALWAEQYPPGTTSAMGELMRSGGAGRYGSDALDRELEKLAASVSSSFSKEFGSISFSCLSSDIERVISIFASVVRKPHFESQKLALWKSQALEGIRRRVEDPTTVASVAFTELVYGDSAYGKITRSTDISRISRQNISQLYRYLVRPDEAILVVTGAVDKEEIARLIQQEFGSWVARGSKLPPPPPVKGSTEAGIYFIELPFKQASVEVGHQGVGRFTEDYPAIDVFNEAFGSGGFGSRLMQRVRTELGLSYGIYGAIAPGVVRGINYLFLQTKGDSVGPAIRESIEVLKSLQAEPLSPRELSEKKSAIEQSYVFNFSSSDAIAGRGAQQELLHYPERYDETYLPAIEAVTADDVLRVAKQRWQIEEFLVVVVGNAQARASLEKEVLKEDSPIFEKNIIELRFDESIVRQ
jgi:zinc protease